MPDISEKKSEELKMKCKYPDSLDTEVEHNGHTVQWNIQRAETMKATVTIAETEYKLVQFHFHVPTEHTFDGKQQNLEIHFVHSNLDTGALAVLGFLFEEGADDDEEVFIKEISPVLPMKAKERKEATVDVNDLEFAGEWCHYDGSLTTPPCSEDVKWFVNLKVLKVAKSTIAKFKKCLHVGCNARPVCDRNGRDLFKIKAKHDKTARSMFANKVYTMRGKNPLADDGKVDIKAMEFTEDELNEVFDKFCDKETQEMVYAEFEKALQALGYGKDDNLHFKFRQLDRDESQIIERDEFMRLITDLKIERPVTQQE
eukprot:UN33815